MSGDGFNEITDALAGHIFLDTTPSEVKENK